MFAAAEGKSTLGIPRAVGEEYVGEANDASEGNPTGHITEQERSEADKGHSDREEMPEDVFLEPGKRKYPVREKHDGEWVYSRNLLLAAAREARMHGHESLAARADAIRRREFKGEAEDKCAPAMDAAIALALDRDTNRNIDGDGHLRVKHNLLTRAEVSPYRGEEINNVEPLGLDPNRIYYLYRLPDELKKGAETLEGKPILIKHKPISSDDHPEELVVGAVSNPELAGDELYGDLSVWTRGAVGAILNGSKKHISLGYHYKPVMTPGVTPKGQKFDGVMKNIRYNHLALVENPRVKDAVVADSSDELLWSRLEQSLISAFPGRFC